MINGLKYLLMVFFIIGGSEYRVILDNSCYLLLLFDLFFDYCDILKYY